MRFTTRRWMMLMAVIGAAVISQPAAAEIVRLRVDGALTSVENSSGLAPNAAVGDAYSLFYSFESTTPGHREGTTPPSILRYDAIVALTLRLGGVDYMLDNLAMREITIQNDECQPFSGCTDSYGFVASNSIIDPLFFQTSISLTSNTPTEGSALTSLALSAGAPDVAAFSSRSAQIFFSDGFTNQQSTLRGSITSISPVPLPGALWLLCSGLAAFGLRSRRGMAS